MAYNTTGFQLTQFPRSPAVPTNIGAVDVREIYDGVRQGLASMENVRRAPASMALADAEIAAKTAEAPLGTRLALAQTEGVEQQTPLKTAILAAEASPEMQEAKRQALINRSTKQPAGDVQLAASLAAARLRLIEDPTDAHAAQMVAALEPLLLNKSAVSARNPQGVIDTNLQKGTDANQTRRDIAADTNQTRRDISTDANATRTGISDEDRKLRDTLTRLGFVNAQDVAKIGAQGRVNAAQAQFTGKIYETAAQKNEKVHEELSALKVLDETAQEYLSSKLGSGVVVGSAPIVALRTFFGDDSGKKFVAASALSMKSAIETMRGLGAMSEREFEAAMSQLPRTNEPAEAIQLKLDFLNSVRPWIAARNDMFIDQLAKGLSPIQAHEIVRKSLPMPSIGGTAQPPSTEITSNQSAAPRAFATEAEADAAGARGEIQAGSKITVGGQTGTWQPRQ